MASFINKPEARVLLSIRKKSEWIIKPEDFTVELNCSRSQAYFFHNVLCSKAERSTKKWGSRTKEGLLIHLEPEEWTKIEELASRNYDYDVEFTRDNSAHQDAQALHDKMMLAKKKYEEHLKNDGGEKNGRQANNSMGTQNS